jgi:hypothetical protein
MLVRAIVICLSLFAISCAAYWTATSTNFFTRQRLARFAKWIGLGVPAAGKRSRGGACTSAAKLMHVRA